MIGRAWASPTIDIRNTCLSTSSTIRLASKAWESPQQDGRRCVLEKAVHWAAARMRAAWRTRATVRGDRGRDRLGSRTLGAGHRRHADVRLSPQRRPRPPGRAPCTRGTGRRVKGRAADPRPASPPRPRRSCCRATGRRRSRRRRRGRDRWCRSLGEMPRSPSVDDCPGLDVVEEARTSAGQVLVHVARHRPARKAPSMASTYSVPLWARGRPCPAPSPTAPAPPARGADRCPAHRGTPPANGARDHLAVVRRTVPRTSISRLGTAAATRRAPGQRPLPSGLAHESVKRGSRRSKDGIGRRVAKP